MFVTQQQYIKHLYEVEERSLNEIHKITGFNYRTVRQYAYKEDWNEWNITDECGNELDFVSAMRTVAELAAERTAV